jgi:hypothetical protein
VSTGFASQVTATSATLNGTVQANQRTADVHFDYGPSAAYGTSTAPAPAGGAIAPGPVAQTASSLRPETTYHYRVVAITPDGTASGEDATFTTPAAGAPGGPAGPGGPGDSLAPTVDGFTLTGAFRAAGRGPSITAAAKRKKPVGATVKYRLSEPATTTLTVERATSGRKVGRTCKKPTRSNRKRRKCTRYVALKGSFSHSGKAGQNAFKFTGRLANKKLKPAKYRLVAVAADAAGNKSAPKRRAFKIVVR